MFNTIFAACTQPAVRQRILSLAELMARANHIAASRYRIGESAVVLVTTPCYQISCIVPANSHATEGAISSSSSLARFADPFDEESPSAPELRNLIFEGRAIALGSGFLQLGG
jgi:hypothetical protein